MIRKKLVICLGLVMVFATIAPMSITTVLGATTDTLTVTFDPQGNISIEISPNTYDFGAIWANGWKNSSATKFTLFNNGSVGMDTAINITSTATNFSLDNTGACSSDNEYGINTTGLDSNGWLDNSTYVNFDTDIPHTDSKQFGMGLHIGDITQDWGEDSVTITFQGSVT